MICGKFTWADWHNLCSKFNPESRNSRYESPTICLRVVTLSAEDMIPGGVFSFDVAFWPHGVCETKSFIKYSESIKTSECILYVSSWCLTSRLYFPPCLKNAERAYTTETRLEGSTSPCQGLYVYIKKEGSFLAQNHGSSLVLLLTFKGTLLVEQTPCSAGDGLLRAPPSELIFLLVIQAPLRTQGFQNSVLVPGHCTCSWQWS